MRLDAKRAGDSLTAAAGDLTRIWRAARVEARAEPFPGTLDGVVESFIAGVGEALVLGREPEDVWARSAGVVRADLAAPGGPTEVWLAEWRLVAEVLAAACDALVAPAEASDLAARAVEAAQRGVDALVAGEGPPRAVVVRSLAGFRLRADSRR